jgi:hypothetical protein
LRIEKKGQCSSNVPTEFCLYIPFILFVFLVLHCLDPHGVHHHRISRENLEETEGVIKNGQSWDTGNIGDILNDFDEESDRKEWFVEPGSDNKSCDGEHDLEVDDDIPQSGDNRIDEYSLGVDDCKCIGVVDASYEGSLLMFITDRLHLRRL